MEISCSIEKDRSFKLNGSQYLWIVETGRLDIFAKSLAQAHSARNYLFTVDRSEAIFGVESLDSANLVIIEIATEPTQLRGINLNDLAGEETERVIAMLKANWWLQEQSALLGYIAENKLPVALLPDKKGYVLFDAQTRSRTPVNKAIASTLATEAYQFYRPLPNIVNNPWQIFRFVVKGFEKNIGGIFLVGIIATLLGMIVPQATALLVNRAIPDRDLSLLWQLENEAWSALEMAGLAPEVKAMPMKLQTVVSEGGSNLSGGQRQRLSIARALVKKPKIILMDEATSALDDRTQDIVTASLDKLSATKIVIAHHLSTIKNADRIYVFDKGSIVEVGSFDELMNEKNLFMDLVESQLNE